MSQENRSTSTGTPARQAGRGREADHPKDIPAPGWKDILARVWRDTSRKNLSLVAGGVTYYMLLALFPALAALVSIYGLIADPAQVAQTVNALSRLMPPSALKLIGDELHHLVSASNGALSLGAVVGLIISLVTASYGVSGMIVALDIAYGEEERRGFIQFYLLTMILTIGLIIGGLIVLALIAVLPVVLVDMGASPTTRWVALIVEWPLLLAFMTTTLAVLYRYGPDRQEARWEWISPGAIAAMILWGTGSLLFTVYVAHFNSYDRTYGGLGTAAMLLTWLWL
ncbi:MAG TPA: YihY/virulence factor BrkB family protein, partial [Acetobacteraceae bacterium]|nr:YihY/virulence factor BrkB family protein [Acetobacteraceae bacterium]